MSICLWTASKPGVASASQWLTVPLFHKHWAFLSISQLVSRPANESPERIPQPSMGGGIWLTVHPWPWAMVNKERGGLWIEAVQRSSSAGPHPNTLPTSWTQKMEMLAFSFFGWLIPDSHCQPVYSDERKSMSCNLEKLFSEALAILEAPAP